MGASSSTLSQVSVGFPSKPELVSAIARFEASATEAEVSHATAERRADLYEQLGELYQDAAMYLKAEDAFTRAVTLLRTGPQDKLAAAKEQLGLLDVQMGKIKEAEKQQMESLHLRERLGDHAGTALSWRDLAAVYSAEHNYKKSVEYAQRAMDAIGNDATVAPAARIEILEIRGFASCGAGDCAEAIPFLQRAVALAKASYGADSLPVALNTYVLGYVCWHGGDLEGAARWMGEGTSRMKAELGWGHPMYIGAMRQYAGFLRERGRVEEAEVAEQVVRHADTVVDARSLTGMAGAIQTAGLR